MTAPGESAGLDVVDAEAGGDVSRVIVGGMAPPPGATVGDRADWLARHGDGLRRLLLDPPDEEPMMNADLVVPASDAAAEAGFIIMEAMGYPPFSGSNAMCTAAVLIDSGRLGAPADGARRLVLEAPGGAVALAVACRGGRVAAVDYAAEPAFVAARGRRVVVPGHGEVGFDLVYGGVFFALVDAAAAGPDPATASPGELAAFGHALVEAARPETAPRHPDHGDAGPLAFALFAGPARAGNGGLELPLACYVHPGVICHGPTGTGTAALLAWRGDGEAVTTVSPAGRRFGGRVVGRRSVGGEPALASVITGHPRILGAHRVPVDPATLGPELAALLEPVR